MSEPRSKSLLDFAITSSIVVLPVMLGMVLLVAVLRPMEPGLRRMNSDRYVSVRQVAALKTFEQAIVARSAMNEGEATAGSVLSGLESCRKEWTKAPHPAVVWMRAVLKHGAEAHAQPADRIATQLAGLDAALRSFSSRDNTRVEHPVGLDLQRWYESANRMLATTVEVPDYPGRRFQVGCSDLADALHALSRGDARMLETLAWRGSEAAKSIAGWQPDKMMEVSPRQVARRNPWGGLAGCVYLGTHADAASATTQVSHLVGGARAAKVCAMPVLAGASAPMALPGEPTAATAPDDARWMVPPSLTAMLQPLDSLRQPGGALYRRYSDARDSVSASAPDEQRRSGNRIVVDGAPVEIGYSLDLTIDPALQALAQKTAACYTGRQDVCRQLAMQRAEDRGQPLGRKLLEGAMVRMAAVAIIDVATGRIEALAGAMSPCTRQEFDGPGRDANCDKRLPYPPRFRADALLNPAVFHDAMPASTIKPIMAAAFLADREVGARWLAAEQSAVKPGAFPARDSLRGQLMRSDSARFLDRMFCGDKNFTDCRRPWDIQATAASFGWNAGCETGRYDCGKQDLLFGRSLEADASALLPPMPVPAGRLLSEPMAGRLAARMHYMPRMALNQSIVARCAAGADGKRRSDDDWEKCRGGSVVDVVAEGWGQGHARSSALGVAGMMATLAAAANGQTELRRPHLVESIRGAAPFKAMWSGVAAQPVGVPRDAAQVILDGLSYSHRAGTARTACEQVFDAKTCKDIDWIAGKTGTPSFPSDGITLDELTRMCRVPPRQRERIAACSSLRPYKWYVATFRTAPGNGPWTKAIGVLTERNWTAQGGNVHGAGDHGPNPSAEIAMQIAGRQRGLIAGAAP